MYMYNVYALVTQCIYTCNLMYIYNVYALVTQCIIPMYMLMLPNVYTQCIFPCYPMYNSCDQMYIPPAGEPVLKAIREGRFPVGYEPRRKKGYTRGQTLLVPCVGERAMDLKITFQFATAILYSKKLLPPVEEGTDGFNAVLGFLRENRVFSGLMANVRTPYPLHPTP